MSGLLAVLGLDPGPVPGIVRLHVQDGRLVDRWTHVVQCSADVAPEILGAFLDTPNEAVVQIERFVVRGRATSDQALTHDLVGLLESTALEYGIRPRLCNASQVKPWATDERLDRAGLLAATKGMRHAKDAARHALFAAVQGGHLPDPLSKEWSNR